MDRSPPSAADNNVQDDLAFLHELPNRPVATVDEAARAILIRMGQSQENAGSASRMEKFLKEGWVRRAWDLAPDAPLDRGTLGFMICRLCRLSRSANQLWSDPTGLGDRRYAYRRCATAGLMPPGSEFQIVSGGELLATLSAADSYLNENN